MQQMHAARYVLYYEACLLPCILPRNSSQVTMNDSPAWTGDEKTIQTVLYRQVAHVEDLSAWIWVTEFHG